MKEFVVRLYDAHVRTNFVERIIQAPTEKDVFHMVSSLKNIKEEIERKFKYNRTIEQVWNGFDYEIIAR